MNDTQPTRVPQKKSRGAFWIGLLILVAFIALGSFGGYNAGITDRKNAEATLAFQSLDEQFQLAQDDVAAGRLEIARQRLQEGILRYDPNYPGAADLLAEVLVKQALMLTPTVTPTPAATPTPDLRGEQVIFDDARSKIAAQDWDGAIQTLDALRKKNLGFRTVEVDGMYFVALRNRGLQKILGSGPYAQDPNLEGGMYDLALAERFGPLDGQAQGFRNFARAYITGASFWELDWAQVQFYLEQVYPFLPNLRDGSGMTAVERYRLATIARADQYYVAEQWCEASTQYIIAQNFPVEQAVLDRANDAFNKCNPPEPTATVTPTPTATGLIPPTETPSSEVPTETPTP